MLPVEHGRREEVCHVHRPELCVAVAQAFGCPMVDLEHPAQQRVNDDRVAVGVEQSPIPLLAAIRAGFGGPAQGLIFLLDLIVKIPNSQERADA